jgi:uncharacterized damage-inducible protein DinB
MTQSEVIDDLEQRVNMTISVVQGFLELPDEQLEKSSSPERWSVLQCLEHLNRYGEFYLPEFSRCLKKAPNANEENFSSGYWGKLFTQGMLPKEKMKTMKAFKSKSPNKSEVNKTVLHTFLDQQKELLSILEQARQVDLRKHPCRLTIPLLKMRLGDTLRFYVFHHIRHVVQAQNELKLIA